MLYVWSVMLNTHWNGNVVIWRQLSELAAQEIVILTTPYALTVKMIQRGKLATWPIPSATNNVSWQPDWKASYAPHVISYWCDGHGTEGLLLHYGDFRMSAMASHSTTSRRFAQTFVQAQIYENIKASRQWPLWEEFTGEFPPPPPPPTKGQ